MIRFGVSTGPLRGPPATQTATTAERGFGIMAKNTSFACTPASIKARNNCDGQDVSVNEPTLQRRINRDNRSKKKKTAGTE